jgi:hypothetical protein
LGRRSAANNFRERRILGCEAEARIGANFGQPLLHRAGRESQELLSARAARNRIGRCLSLRLVPCNHAGRGSRAEQRSDHLTERLRRDALEGHLPPEIPTKAFYEGLRSVLESMKQWGESLPVGALEFGGATALASGD